MTNFVAFNEQQKVAVGIVPRRPHLTPFPNGQRATAAMDNIMSELNERLTASCRNTLQQLDDIARGACTRRLHEAPARKSPWR